MAEVFTQCGNFIMVPKQLARLDYESGNRPPMRSLIYSCRFARALDSMDLLPKCVAVFWKPILQQIINDVGLTALIIDKILTFISERYCLSPTDYSIIDQQRIGWIFYLLEHSPNKLDLCAIFLRLARVLQPWFAEPLAQLVARLADSKDGGRPALISEQKRDVLLRTISMFANPLENVGDEAAATTATEMCPRHELYKREVAMFKKRETRQGVDGIVHMSGLFVVGAVLAEVPAGVANDEEEQNLEMNIDLSKTDRNCKYSSIRNTSD